MQYKNIGFIGLGEMGKPMAKCLAKGGFRLTVFDVRRTVVDELVEVGAAGANSPKEVAEKSQVVITMVNDNRQTDQVLFGPAGAWEGLKKGSVLIMTSTLDPLYCQGIQRKAEEIGVEVLDAPVSGAKIGAESGSLTFMVGGDKKVVDACQPIFQVMGKKVFHMGGVGSGLAIKLLNNIICTITIAGASEAIAVGLEAGVDLNKMLEVMKSSTGSSWVIDHWEFIAGLIKDRPENLHFGKDANLALSFGKGMGKAMPIAEMVAKQDPTKWVPLKSN